MSPKESWVVFEEVKRKLASTSLEIKDVELEWSKGEVRFKCLSDLDLGSLNELAEMFEARDIRLKPEFNYTSPWILVTILVDLQ
jgi:hypothetical protein